MLIDEDECCTFCHEKSSTCANSFGNFTCTCSDGYSGNGTFCEGIMINISLRESYCYTTYRYKFSLARKPN